MSFSSGSGIYRRSTSGDYHCRPIRCRKELSNADTHAEAGSHADSRADGRVGGGLGRTGGRREKATTAAGTSPTDWPDHVVRSRG
jgi:hypothetical protein